MDLAAVLLALTYVLSYLLWGVFFCSLAVFVIAGYLAGRAIPMEGADRRRMVLVTQTGATTSLLALAGTGLGTGSETIRDSAGWQALLDGNTTAFRSSWPAQVDIAIGVLYIVLGLASLMLIGRVNRTGAQYRRRIIQSAGDSRIAEPMRRRAAPGSSL